jgi:hypothetical protein
LQTFGESSNLRPPAASRFGVKVWRKWFNRSVMAGLVALFGAQWMAVPAAASNHFLGVLKGSDPMSPPFIMSPASYDISSQPVTAVFTTQVENLTNHVVTVTVDINVHHVTAYYGQNVADGQPGKPGITFKAGDAPNTTQVTYGTPFQRQLTVQPKGAAPQLVTFSTVMTTCGYFQFDIGKHLKGGGHENLSTGFARILGCTHSGGGGGGGGGGVGGTTGGGTGGTGGVLASTAGLPLANTGLPVAGGLAGIVMTLIGALGLRIRRQ